MTSIIIRLKASELENPDLDIRYKLPERIITAAGGRITDDGYDYGADPDELYLFLKVSDPSDLAYAIDVVNNEMVCGNSLRKSVVLAVKQEDNISIVFPEDYVGDFNVPSIEEIAE